MPAKAAQPSCALGFPSTTLAKWHKQHRHLRDPVCRVHPKFYVQLLSPLLKASHVQMWSETASLYNGLERYRHAFYEAGGKQGNKNTCCTHQH